MKEFIISLIERYELQRWAGNHRAAADTMRIIRDKIDELQCLTRYPQPSHTDAASVLLPGPEGLGPG
jgi:hypothetical protein